MFELDAVTIRRLYFATGLSLRQFAKASGLHLMTLHNLIHGKATRTTGKIVGTLARYFNVDGEMLLLKRRCVENGDND